jgi:hypothetical protein
MDRKQQVVVINTIITTTLKYPDAVGEAQMLQSPQEAASPGVEPLRESPAAVIELVASSVPASEAL